jgi:hypothetical protein
MTISSGQSEPEEVNAYRTDDSEKLAVIVLAQDFGKGRARHSCNPKSRNSRLIRKQRLTPAVVRGGPLPFTDTERSKCPPGVRASRACARRVTSVRKYRRSRPAPLARMLAMIWQFMTDQVVP